MELRKVIDTTQRMLLRGIALSLVWGWIAFVIGFSVVLVVVGHGCLKEILYTVSRQH